VRSSTPLGRLGHVLLTLLALPIAGCLGWAYPTTALTAPLRVGSERNEVHAFRVDVARDASVIDFARDDSYVLREVRPSAGGWVSPQVKVALDYGWYANFVALSYWQHLHHTLLVRLYRPGYRTVEVRAWEYDTPVEWNEAVTGEDREAAIDDLASTYATDNKAHWRATADGLPPGTRPRDPRLFRCLASGEASAAHRQALLFIAEEYARLARELPGGDDDPLRARVTLKARALRERAGPGSLEDRVRSSDTANAAGGRVAASGTGGAP
jgi:hypothetical protein